MSTSVGLKWSPSTDNVGVTAYQVLRNGVVIATVTGTSYTDTTVQPRTMYEYRIRAKDAAGNLSGASYGLSVYPY
jgi:chitodextrinase